MVDMYSVVCVCAGMQDMFKDERVRKRGSGVGVKKIGSLVVRVWHMSSAS
jgi:hypothetical protein